MRNFKPGRVTTATILPNLPLARRTLALSASLLALTAALPAAAEQDQSIDEIIVVSERGEVDATKMSRGTQSLLKTAGSFGDPLWALTSLPGISFGGGDMDEPVVRGSGPQDNLYLIDDMQVGYLFHELSDSVISKNVVRSFDLQAAAFGAEYGSATGGVIDVALRDPAADGYRGNLDISQLKSGFLIEGPLGENAAFYIDARYNTAHFFLTRFEENDDFTSRKMPKSHDYTARYKWQGDSIAVTLTALGAQDTDEVTQNDGVVWPIPLGTKDKRYFHTQGVKIEKTFESGATFSATLSHTLDKSRFDYQGTRFEDREQDGYYARSHYNRTIGKHDLTIGLNYAHIKGSYDYDTDLVYCDEFHPSCATSGGFVQNTREETFEDTELYIKDIYSVTDNLRLELGLQASMDIFLSEEFVEPRVALFWDTSETSQFYARAGMHHQRPDIEQILTLVRTPKLQKNETSTHFMVGNRWQIADGWYMKTEAYYKDIYTVQFPDTTIETNVDGKSYGAELLIAKQVQEEGFYGWLALSYGKSTRKDRITGTEIDYRYNTPISATLAVNYDFGKGWNLGATFRVQSGDAYTPVENVTLHPDNYFVFEYGESNSLRTPTYHRLDIRLEKQSSYSFGNITYYLDLLNVYGRDNISDREYPWYLVSQTAGGGWQANADESSNIPFYGALGVNIAF